MKQSASESLKREGNLTLLVPSLLGFAFIGACGFFSGMRGTQLLLNLGIGAGAAFMSPAFVDLVDRGVARNWTIYSGILGLAMLVASSVQLHHFLKIATAH